MHPGSLEDIGPLVEHVYEVRHGSGTGNELIAQTLIRLPVMSLPSWEVANGFLFPVSGFKVLFPVKKYCVTLCLCVSACV